MPAAHLLIGPLLRRVVDTRATIWVETAAPAVVTVRTADGATGTAPTFSAYDHHYALVVVEGLAPDSETTYEVLVDDEVVWPVPSSGFPPSVIRTRAADDRDQPVNLIFGSCRETTQHATTRKLPPDALDAYARRLMADPESATRCPTCWCCSVTRSTPTSPRPRCAGCCVGAGGGRRAPRPTRW